MKTDINIDNYLPQSAIVTQLISHVLELLPSLPENQLKAAILDTLEEFKSAITPSAIYLEEVYDYAGHRSIKLSETDAIEILQNANYDLEYGFADTIETHVNEFIASRNLSGK